MLLVDPRIHTDGPLTCLNCAVLNRKGKCKLLGRPPAERFVAGTRRDECCPAMTAEERRKIEDAQMIAAMCDDFDGVGCAAPLPHTKYDKCENCLLCNREEN